MADNPVSAAKTAPPQPDNVAAGMAYALAGFALLSVGDGLIKSTAGLWPGMAVAALRFLMGAVGLGIVLLVIEGPKGFRFPSPKVQLARGFFLAAATLTFFSSIFLMPLATAVSIQFMAPLLTAVISAILYRETISPGRWIATLVAFVGVIIVLRPSFADLGWAALLPLAAAFGMSGLMITNARAAGTGSVLLMQFLVAAIAAPLLILAATIGHFSGYPPLQVGWPAAHVFVVCATVAVSASFAHMLIYTATVRGSAAAVAPMVYVQILVAIGIGVIFYGDYPDLVALAGTGVIIASGIYLLRDGRR
ncbi:DMT family transporter [Blastomonas aquatica]|uniref:Membrane protein n=1 Tax=Blastomonas aquatica TaxID=1510276 RepID=A0ABQ1JFF9_9SPHN|nr:DMT family transporter [Blastomonas aquatica]GGB64710.1 membrane protein [Blastomonas aquatica]